MGATALAIAAMAWVVWPDGQVKPSPHDGSAVRPAVRSPAGQAATAQPDLFDRVAASGAADGARSTQAVEDALYGRGSLRRSEPDGGWALDGKGVLRPAIGLRRRFDQLLTGLGEATADELGRLLSAQATGDLDPAGAAQVMKIWQAYIGLQRGLYRTTADPADAGTWQAALDERILARRAALGPAWADAFYRDEETAVRAHIASRLGSDGRGADTSQSTASTGGLPSSAQRPAPGDDLVSLQQRRVAELGADAARRLAEEDASQQRWDLRLAEAKAQVALLQQAPELAALQRGKAIDAYLSATFEPSEQLRVRALLKLEPAN